MKKHRATIFLLALIFIISPLTSHAATVTERLSGRILLQAQENGEAWYVNPADQKRYYLGRPYDAWNAMRSLGLGISNVDLNKIPKSTDSWDGNADLVNRLKGKILLQIEDNGEGWYVSPVNGKRYYLGKPDDAFQVMRSLGLGIAQSDLFQIEPNIVILNIFYNGAGSKEADEFVEIKNQGSLDQTFNTWKLSDKEGHEFVFPNEVTLKPGQNLKVYTNTGAYSFESSSAIWNNTGDMASLRGANNALIDIYSY